MNGTDRRLPRGMRDLLPEAARRRREVVAALIGVFELYGFEPLETPALELAASLLGKYGPDAEKLIYRVGLGEEKDLALRYDLSVPLARVCASYPELPRPFRRYQVAPVWRGERPQRGRYREFVQADLDIVGSSSSLADAEIITVVIRALEALGFPATLTKLNNRKILAGIGHYLGVPEALQPALMRAMDKLDRVGFEGLRLELAAVGLPTDLVNRQRQAVGRWLRGQADRWRLERDLAASMPPDAPLAVQEALDRFLDRLVTSGQSETNEAAVEVRTQELMALAIADLRGSWPAEVLPDSTIDRLLALLQASGGDHEKIAALERQLTDPLGQEGLGELSEVLSHLAAVGLPESRLTVDVTMVRGLDYYTGTIFETVVTHPPIGSITGGGRYDGLVRLFGRDLPAVGTSFGVDRLVDVMDELGIKSPGVGRPPAEVLVTRFDAATTGAALRLAEEWRAIGLRAESYLEMDPLGEQIRYALRRGIPYVAVVGPDEMASGEVTLRELGSQSQLTLPTAEATELLRNRLKSLVGEG